MSYCSVAYNFRTRTWDIPGNYILIGIGVLLSSFILYVITLAPTVIWGDSAAFALHSKELRFKYGAEGHPLFIILGRLFSFLPFELAYSLNLLSAVSASLGVFLVYLVIYEITRSKISSLAGALALCLSHAFWLHAVIAEVYDLNAAFIAAIILFLLKWRNDKDNYNFLYIVAFLFGLGLTNHRLMAFETIGIVFFVIATEPRVFLKLRVMFFALLSFFIGSLPLIILFLKDLPEKPVVEIADTFTGGEYKEAVIKYSPKIFQEIGLYLAYLFYQFPLIGFLLGFAGIVALFRRDKRLAVFFALLISVNAAFFIKFGPGYGSTKYTFYISTYMVFSLLIGYGFYLCQGILRDRGYSTKKYSLLMIMLVFLSPILLYNITPYASKALNMDVLKTRTIPYRDNEKYFLNPVKRGYYGAAQFAKEALTKAKPNSIILADYTLGPPLMYFQEIKGMRKDITLLYINRNVEVPGERIRPSDFISQHYENKDIYLADIKKEKFYRIRSLQDEYDFVPEGVLYRVVRKPR